ncbi:NTP transferase domain-containing protein [Candidatus Peribacteria bacterium]|nr:NTP transferase domain-containing protein [Candidatus Peribacteria bacterium]
MRVIIIAAGDGTRWKNYLGVPKHLVPIDNEPILHRTVRLLKKLDINDIHIVGPNDDRYHVSDTRLYVPVKNAKNHDAVELPRSKLRGF